MDYIYLELDKDNTILSYFTDGAIDGMDDFENENTYCIELGISEQEFIERYATINITDGSYIYDEEHQCIVQLPERVDQCHAQEVAKAVRDYREHFVFPIINRGNAGYWSLTDEQVNNLQQGYKAWLDATDTLIIPEGPQWLDGDKNAHYMK